MANKLAAINASKLRNSITKPLVNHAPGTQTFPVLKDSFTKSVPQPCIISLIDSCTTMKNLKQIHGFLIRNNLDNKQSAKKILLFCAVSDHGSLDYADLFFSQIIDPNPFLWNTMIRGFSEANPKKSVIFYNQMLQNGFFPDNFTFHFVFKALRTMGAKKKGREAHGCVLKLGSLSDVYVGNSLIHMFAGMGEIEGAHQLFDELPQRNLISWYSLISGYAQSDRSEEASKLFDELEEKDLELDDNEFAGALTAFSEVKDLNIQRRLYAYLEKRRIGFVISALERCAGMKELKKIHGFFIRNGLDQNAMAISRVLIFCAISELGSLNYAGLFFSQIAKPSLFLCNTMIRAYAAKDYPMHAIDLYNQMVRIGMVPDRFTFPSILNSSGSLVSLPKGQEFHGTIVKLGLESDNYTHNSLVTMYAKCGSMDKARQVFNELSEPDIVSWNSLIAGLILNEHWDEAIKVFSEMETVNLEPNRPAIVCVLTACAKTGNFQLARSIHKNIEGKVRDDVVLGTALVDLYAQQGSIEQARKVFDEMSKRNVFSWNVLLAGYSRLNRLKDAVDLFMRMELSDVKPNQATMVILLSVCTRSKDLALGKWIHYLVEKHKLKLTLELENALLEFYTKLGNLSIASQVFERMPRRDLFSWNSMIAGYANSKHGKEALNLFRDMERLGVEPNNLTLRNVLLACGNMGALGIGEKIHGHINKREIELDVLLGTALLGMYSKCGCTAKAWEVFIKLPDKNVFSWTSMIIGFAMNGRAKEAVDLFSEMLKSGITPDGIAFLGVVMACNIGGLVEEGYQYFSRMKEFGVTPNLEHYQHMVELLGRVGLFNQAIDFVKEMQVPPTASIWGALVSACRCHGNFILEEQVGTFLTNLEHDCLGLFVHLTNIYASLGRWDAIVDVKNTVKAKGVRNVLGSSLIELNGVVYEFFPGDTPNTLSEETYALLDGLIGTLSSSGYRPNISQVFLGVDDER